MTLRSAHDLLILIVELDIIIKEFNDEYINLGHQADSRAEN